MADAFDRLPGRDTAKGDAFDRFPVQDEGFLKSSARTSFQLPLGAAEATPYGIATGLWQLLGTGESLDPEEIDQIKKISERNGIPFDEEKYMEAVQNAAGSIPTVGNLASKAEDITGLPLEAKTHGQKLLRFAGSAGKFQPGGTTQKVIAGATAAGAKAGLEAIGVPEVFSDLAAFPAGHLAGNAASHLPSPSIGTKTKPSGLPERQFETLTKPREVSESRLGKIENKVENDFRTIADKILDESPLKQTRDEIKANPAFKQEVGEAMEQLEQAAANIPKTVHSKVLKQHLVDTVLPKSGTGISPGEFDKSYRNTIINLIKDTADRDLKASDFVRQYRKTNKELSGFYDPSKPAIVNWGKKEALQDYNRAIAEVIEQQYPGTALSEPFRAQNKQWAQASDLEFIDKFTDSMFDGKINFREARKFFENQKVSAKFKKALGPESYKAFTQLMDDFLKSEAPFKQLKIAKNKGFDELFHAGLGYILHPNVGYAKATFDAGKKIFKSAMNALLDKPRIAITWKEAVDSLKAGDFKTAERQFKTLKGEIEEPSTTKPPFKEGVEIEVAGQRIQPEGSQRAIEFKQGKPAQQARAEPPKPEAPKPQPTIEEPKTPFEKQKQKFSNDLFEKAVSGKSLSPSESNYLKKVRVASLQTRGKGQQFHGAKKPISELHNDIYGASGDQNIYGPGFYTTDALDIAQGYSKARKRTDQPTIYTVNEKTPQKLYNAEQPISKELKQKLDDKIEVISDALSENPKNIRELFDKIADFASSEGIPAYEAQEYFSLVQDVLTDAGYDGMSHKGGLLTNNPEHLVKIYWKPENLQIQEMSYPKAFKKVAKSVKPPELPPTPKKAPEKPKVVEPKAAKAPKKDLSRVTEKYSKIIEIERKMREIEKGKSSGVSASLVGEGRHVHSDLKKGNIKKEAQIEKLRDYQRKLFDEIDALTTDYPKDFKDKLHEEFFHNPLADKHYMPDIRKVSSNEAPKKAAESSTKQAKLKELEKGLEHAKNNLAEDLKELKRIEQEISAGRKGRKGHDNQTQRHLLDEQVRQGRIRVYEFNHAIDRLKRETEESRPLKERMEEAKKAYKEKKVDDKPKQDAKIEAMERQDISKKGLKEQKAYLIEELDKAIAKAPKPEPFPVKLKNESRVRFGERIDEWKKRNAMDKYLTFKVPGDGTFTIKNHLYALQAFRDSVEKRWPDKPLKLSKKELQQTGSSEKAPTQEDFLEYIKKHGTVR